MKTKEMGALADAVAGAIKGAIDAPKVAGNIGPLEARIATLEKQLEEARSEINYLTWARQQETANV